MTTNQEWLFSLTLEEYLEWMESEHYEPNPDCSAMLYRMYTENMKHEPCSHYEPKDDVSGYGADFNVVEPNFDNIKAVEMDASRFEAVEMDASRLVVREPDSREKLESDMREWWRVGLPGIQEKAENVINYNEALKWLDRQEKITLTERHKRERELGEAFDGLTEQVDELTAERDELKAKVEELTTEAEKARPQRHPFVDLMIGALDSRGNELKLQERVEKLEAERDELKEEIAKYEHDCGLLFDEKHKLTADAQKWADAANAQRLVAIEQADKVQELTAERDKLKELNGYHAVQYELASEDCDRLQAQVDRLTAELEKAINNLNSANEDFENARAELTAERDYWKEQFMHCLTVAIRQERGDVLDRLMSYPRPADLIEPYQLVTDEVYTLRDFLAESEKERELHRKKQDECDELQKQVDELTNAGRKMSTELANMQDYITKVRAGRERYRSMCSEMATKIHDALMVMDEGMA